MIQFPYINQPNSMGTFPMSGLSYMSLTQIRTIIREELQKALHPEESRPSVTIKCEWDGKCYEGTVYLIEDEEKIRDENG